MAQKANIKKLNREACQVICDMLEMTVQDAAHRTVTRLAKRITGADSSWPREGATPIGMKEKYLHGLLLGNWMMVKSPGSGFFNESAYTNSRRTVYERLLMFIKPRDFVLGRNFVFVNCTPYAPEIDEAPKGTNRRYQARNGILRATLYSFTSPQSGFIRLYNDLVKNDGHRTFYKVETSIVNNFDGNVIPYQRKKKNNIGNIKKYIWENYAFKNDIKHVYHPDYDRVEEKDFSKKEWLIRERKATETIRQDMGKRKKLFTEARKRLINRLKKEQENNSNNK